jgi:hypothetical protein
MYGGAAHGTGGTTGGKDPHGDEVTEALLRTQTA